MGWDSKNMDENYISLLWPGDKKLYKIKTQKLGAAVVSSLDIEKLCSNVSIDNEESSYIQEIISNICWEEEVISYRQESFEDIISSKELTDFLQGLLMELKMFIIKIYISPPLGSSYARDIAQKQGISFEQLTTSI